MDLLEQVSDSKIRIEEREAFGRCGIATRSLKQGSLICRSYVFSYCDLII